MARMINEQCAVNCDVTVVGRTACKAMMKGSSSICSLHLIETASVLWEFLRGRKLPGVLALDRVFFSSIFCRLFPLMPTVMTCMIFESPFWDCQLILVYRKDWQVLFQNELLSIIELLS